MKGVWVPFVQQLGVLNYPFSSRFQFRVSQDVVRSFVIKTHGFIAPPRPMLRRPETERDVSSYNFGAASATIYDVQTHRNRFFIQCVFFSEVVKQLYLANFEAWG
jgi:hypothetical protein